MDGIWKKKWFWILVGLIVIGIIWWSNRKVDGSKGGILDGPSHRNGGIKAVIRSNGEKIELQGGEDILTSEVNKIKDRYICEGTPGGIASSLNVIGGGVKFDDNGNCIISRIPIRQV